MGNNQSNKKPIVNPIEPKSNVFDFNFTKNFLNPLPKSPDHHIQKSSTICSIDMPKETRDKPIDTSTNNIQIYMWSNF
jgi:hypothetical protein